jgi:hypothetical protein
MYAAHTGIVHHCITEFHQDQSQIILKTRTSEFPSDIHHGTSILEFGEYRAAFYVEDHSCRDFRNLHQDRTIRIGIDIIDRPSSHFVTMQDEIIRFYRTDIANIVIHLLDVHLVL